MNGLSRLALAVILLVAGLTAGCTHLSSGRNGASDRLPLSAKEIERIREQLVVHPLPENALYARTRQACFFFVEHPDDASMIPVGMLKSQAYVVVKRRDGEWADVQLTSGQLGSVMSVNLRDLTDEEDLDEGYLESQPALQPLPLPQASARTEDSLDPVLLGG